MAAANDHANDYFNLLNRELTPFRPEKDIMIIKTNERAALGWEEVHDELLKNLFVTNFNK